ncbi:MAG TPA: hypothetical protein VE465_29285 [Streptosporangiaceae bacterium]|nr:hypothetical protein [Streptosporangiaceae bacterium]
MRVAVEMVRERWYTDLTRIACLVLDDGTARPGGLLAAARTAVQRAAGRALAKPSSGQTYPELRRRLAGRLVADSPAPSRLRYRGPLGRAWLRRAPGPGPEGDAAAAGQDRRDEQTGPTRAALRRLSRHERLVYVLVRVEGLAPGDIGGELDHCLMVTATDVARTLARVDAATGLSAAEQSAELRAFDPTVIRLRPAPLRGRRWRLFALAALAVLVAVGAGGYSVWRQTQQPGDPIVIGADLWRRQHSPDVMVWPTQGGRTSDRELIRRARDSWLRNARTPPMGRLFVLYAGEIGDATTVIMRDSPGVRSSPLIAQYVERPLSRGVESVRELGIGSADLILIDALSNRYLVPPWRTDLRVSPLDRPRPEWRSLPVHNGVSDPLPWSWFDVRCQFYVAFQAADRTPRAPGPPATITMLASHVSASATPGITFRVPGRTRYDKTALDSRSHWDAVRALACSGGTALQESADLRVGQLWQGRLPERGGTARIFTVERAGGTADQSDQALLIDDEGEVIGHGDTNGDHVLWASEMAAAVWWRPSRSDRWYLVVAAATDVPRFYVVGELGRHEPRGDDRSLIVPALADSDVGRRPVVAVVVAEPDGDRSMISP